MGKHKSPSVSKFYKIEGGKAVREARTCPRCGTFMAKHKDRLTCGKCAYTEFLD